LRARPSGKRTPIPRAFWPMQPGFAPGWSAGPDTTAKPSPAVMLDGWLELQAAKRGIALLMSNHDV
jgi:hypothetical protein